MGRAGEVRQRRGRLLTGSSEDAIVDEVLVDAQAHWEGPVVADDIGDQCSKGNARLSRLCCGTFLGITVAKNSEQVRKTHKGENAARVY